MHIQSITVSDLRDNLSKYIETHPEDKDKQIYFDGLHINGKIDKYFNGILELW